MFPSQYLSIPFKKTFPKGGCPGTARKLHSAAVKDKRVASGDWSGAG